MKNRIAALLCALACSLVTSAHAASPVEMLIDTDGLQPSTTLEFRFAKPMITADGVGIAVTGDEAPIAISPQVGGRFVWLSRSSGVFTAEAPWPLGGNFTITMKDGLQDAEGKKLKGSFKQVIASPSFGRTFSRGVADKDDDTCAPVARVLMAFNLGVNAESAGGLFRYVNKEGAAVDAKVNHATRSHYFHVPIEHEDWEKRWRTARGLQTDENTDRDGSIPSRLVIEPVAPLTPGSWRLEIKAGLTSLDGKHRIAKAESLTLGKVESFDIRTLRAENYINSGRQLTIEFTHSLAPDITPESAGRFLRVEPPVENLTFDGWSDTLMLSGGFEQGRDYQLHIGEDVISGDALPFVGKRSVSFRFQPVKPRLYLPEITASQIQGGHRKFDVLSANLAAITITARLVAPEDAAKAIFAFGKYERDNADYENHEFYQPLPDDSFRSELIAERRIELPSGKLDERQITSIDWKDILGGRKTGVIFLTVEGQPRAGAPGKSPGAQALIQLTDLGVMWKKIAEGLQVTVFSMETGQAIKDAYVTLLDKEFQTTRKAATGADGIATPEWADESEWLVLRKDGDTHALRTGMAADDLPMYAFQIPIEYANWISFGEINRPMRAMVFTDRPLYRPGESVRVKGVLRDLTEDRLALPKPITCKLMLRDPRGNTVLTKDIRADARGAFDTEITAGSTMGSWMLLLEAPDVQRSPWSQGFNCRFEVADFQPDAFEVKLDAPERLNPGQKPRAEVSARYYFGSPLGQASLRWSIIERKEYFYPPGYEMWTFQSSDDEKDAPLTLRGDGRFDGTKPFVIEPQLPSVAGSSRRAQLTVELTDINQQTVSASAGFTREAADFHLGSALPDGRVARAGEELPVQVIAVRPDGKPMDELVDVQAELIHRRFETVRVRGAGNAITFRTETIEQTVAKASGRTLRPVSDQGYWKVAGGETVRFRIERPGGYHLRFTARDSGGREVVGVLPFYASGSDEVAWDYRNPAHVELVADKQEYRPGETARLLVKSPISGEAIVTIERGQRILRRMHVPLSGNAPEIEIPLTAADAPNVFVSLMLIRGREQSTLRHKMPSARYGVAMLRVRRHDEQLQMRIQPAKAEVQPGEELSVEVRVADESGKPLTDTEVTLFAPDEGILALTGFERPMPERIFHAPIPLAIRSGLSLFGLLPEDPEALEFSNKGYLIGGGGDGPAQGMKLRSEFPGTACWLPKLRTDSAGIARATFAAPDALTRYRLVAVAHAGSNGFGSAESSFAIRQPLMILPGLGQAANVGDQIAARAVVRNESGRDAAVDVMLTLDATAEAVTPGSLRQRIQLKSGTATAVDFPLRLIAMGDAEWTWSATLDPGGKEISDQTVSRLAIGSAAPLLRETHLTESRRFGKLDLLGEVNPQLLEGSGTIDVTFSNTRLASLRESAMHLMEYPYGCAEQITSGMIPWLLLDELRPVMPQLAARSPDATAQVQSTLDRLFAMQTADGGIGYWPSASSGSHFASAYVAVACSLAKSRPDIRMPAGQAALLDFLSRQLRVVERISHEDRALMLFALAASGRTEPAYHENLYQHRKELTGEARAWLALAIHAGGGPKKMIEALLDPKVTSPDAVTWFGSPARERAVQLLAWSIYKPGAREIAKLVNELLALRHNGHWGTTQNNAWALLALSSYYRAVEKGSPDVSAALIAAEQVIPVSLNAETLAVSHGFEHSPQNPPGPLVANHRGGGTLFAETRFAVRPALELQPAQNRGYAVSRSYHILGDDGKLTDVTNLRVGDRVVVTLHIETARPGHFVVIDDPLPAIFEAINPAFQTRIAGAGPRQQDWISDHREMRRGRVLYFCNHLAPGTYVIRYLARVRMAGNVLAGATKAEEMYRPERFGLGEVVRITSMPAID